MNILVFNANAGQFPIQLRKKYPDAKILCCEFFEGYEEWLQRLGFETCRCYKYVDGKKVLTFEALEGMKFDLVLGNPPYQAPQKSKGRNGGGDALWDKFAIKAIEVCKDYGFISFITPTGWRKPKTDMASFNEVSAKMKSKQIISVSMCDTFDSSKFFEVGTRFDLWTIQNCKPYKPTIINDENGNIVEMDISKMPFIPNYDIENTMKMFSSNPNENYDVIYSRSAYGNDKDWISDVEDSVHCYPCVHAINKDGIRYVWSSLKDNGMFGVSKVILGNNGLNDVVIDMEGQYGMTNNTFGIAVTTREEAEILRVHLLGLKNIIPALQWTLYNIDWRVFAYLKRNFWKV